MSNRDTTAIADEFLPGRLRGGTMRGEYEPPESLLYAIQKLEDTIDRFGGIVYESLSPVYRDAANISISGKFYRARTLENGKTLVDRTGWFKRFFGLM